ncbi:MAG: response regulator [Pseudomonadota bacterium]|nr:response regulator [Pseudomonadota bacterium]
MNRRILLIEDNEENRYLATFLLETHGWKIVHAADGPLALTTAAGIAPALILLDIQLPGMDGYAVARALRSQPALDGVPIIAVTSYAMPGDRERCMAAGCNGYIEKPIDPDTFVRDIETFAPGTRGDAA